MKNVIALDIGGTSIKSAIVNSNGIFLENSCNIISIDSNKDKDYILNKFIHPIKENIKLLNATENSFDGIAISICGPFDYEKGVCLIKNLDKYDSIYNQNIKKILQEKLSISTNIPIIFDPDAWSYGRGEVCFNDYENYNYLAESIKSYPSPSKITAMMNNNQYINTRHIYLLGDIVTIHIGFKN